MKNIGHKFIGDAKIYALSPIIDRMIAVFLIPLYTGYLSTEEYGQISYIFMIGRIFAPIIGLGLGTAFWKYYKSTVDTDMKAEVVYITTYIPIIFGIVLIAVLYPINAMLHSDESNLIVFYLAGLTVFTIFSKGMGLLRAYHKAKEYISIAAIMSVTKVLLIIAMVVVLAKGYRGVIEAQIIYFFIAAVIGALLLKGKIKRSRNVELHKSIVWFSIPLMLGNVSSIIMNVTDKMMLNAILGKTDLGLYTFALNFGLLTKAFILVPFFLAWSPLRWELYNFGKGREERFSQITKLIVAGFCVLAIAVGTCSILIAQVLSQNDSYLASQDLIPLFAITQAIWGLYNYELMGFHFSGKTRKVPLLILALGVANIVLNIYLIPIYGYRGAAIATMIAYIMLRYVTAKMSSSLFAYKRSIWKENVLICVAVAFSILLGRASILFGIGVALMSMTVAIAIFLALAWRFAFIDRDVIKKFAELLKVRGKTRR